MCGVLPPAISGGRYSLTAIRLKTKITGTKIGAYVMRLPIRGEINPVDVTLI
jgi:hypothetical protein